ncbi:MAG: hypothetical protein Q9199_001636 [Rusavskia elegans]
MSVPTKATAPGRQFGGQTRRLLRTAPPAERERRQDGLARENIKSFMPRADPNYSDRITDIFALDLGSDTACVLESHDHRTYTSLDRPISPSAVLSRDRVEPTPRGSDREAAATVYTPHAITVTAPLPA